MAVTERKKATLEDFYAIPEDRRFHELIAGEIIEKATPSGEHGDAQSWVVGAVKPSFQRRPGSGGPGGWWIVTEVEVLLDTGDIVRPDVVGWRRERCSERPTGFPIKLRPDWICEVVTVARAERGETVRPEPFEAIELAVGTLFGDDPP